MPFDCAQGTIPIGRIFLRNLPSTLNLMSTERFYAELPLLYKFVDSTNIENFVAVPPDWYAVITDITGSTRAIEAGRYKEVNLLGASSIAVVLNQAGAIEVPFVFGGDGATILIPPTLLEPVKPALYALQRIAQAEFNLELRVGLVPIEVINDADRVVQIAKLKVSEHYSQAMFAGGGLNYATDLIKNPQTADHYKLKMTASVEANLTGLECRWQPIPSRHGETVSLLVLATAHDPLQNYMIYRNVVEKIYEIYGMEEDFHPVTLNHLHLTLNSKKLVAETKVKMGQQNWLKQWLHLSKIQFETILGLVFSEFKLTIGEMNWSNFKTIITTTSDYKKFDDMLRMIISGTSQQREKLTQYLSDRFQQGELVYGIHVASSALMTCLVFERSGAQVHFVDGADGGYALAAKSLKAQLKRKTENWQAYTKLHKARQRHFEQSSHQSNPNLKGSLGK